MGGLLRQAATLPQPDVTQAFVATPPALEDWKAAYGTVYAIPAPQRAARGHFLVEAAYRAFEFTTAAVLLVLLAPFMLVEALLIRLDSPGPALFTQRRVGQSAAVSAQDITGREGYVAPPGGYEADGVYLVPRTFGFLKFRTMHVDAKERFPDLYRYEYEPGQFRSALFKNDSDPRVTRLGLLLRRLTLDELPNLWCVLTGSMRLVGPRPEIPQLLHYYTAAELEKFSVKPGITGLAQVNGRGLLTLGETLDWDLTYVRTRTVWLDLRILVLTAWFVLVRRGAF